MLKRKSIGYLICLFALLSSCAKTNYIAKIKTISPIYSGYYANTSVVADYDKQFWVVFSDREDNVSYHNPGGKVELKNGIGFLEPFFVIEEEGDYLCLIKYEPALIEESLLNNKAIRSRNNVSYYGWINKSNLILSNGAVIDSKSGRRNKYSSIITDASLINTPQVFFDNDSVRVFKDPDMSIATGKISLNSLFYVLKYSEDRSKCLISRKEVISLQSSSADVIGWVPSSVTFNTGNRLHVGWDAIRNNLMFTNSSRDIRLAVHESIIDQGAKFSKNSDVMRHLPINNFVSFGESIGINTGIAIPIIDHTFNYVNNIDGNQITYEHFKEIESNLRKINIIFVFEGKEQVLSTYPSIPRAIQNLTSSFNSRNDKFEYKFGAVFAYQTGPTDTEPKIKTLELAGGYANFISKMNMEIDNVATYYPLSIKHAWSGVKGAIQMVQSKQEETNILIIVGESGDNEYSDSALTKDIADANCRILGFQVHSTNDNVGNNFVHEIESMIEYYARQAETTKREKIVYIDQLRQGSRFRESVKNVYALDFPDRSMSQGWIAFPEKRASVPLDILVNSADTLIQEVKKDNLGLIDNLYHAFNTISVHRLLYTSAFKGYNGLGDDLPFNKDLILSFKHQQPYFYIPAEDIIIPRENSEFYLLLSRIELSEMLDFINTICINWTSSSGRTSNSTDIFRKQLYDTYMNRLASFSPSAGDVTNLRSTSFSMAHYRIIGSPAYNVLLERYTISDIMNKSRITDDELNQLLTYFLQKKSELDRYLRNPENFESNGEAYYWVPQTILP